MPRNRKLTREEMAQSFAREAAREDAARLERERTARECGRDPHELGWRRDIIGQTGDRSGRTWIKPDGTYYTFAPGVRMVLFEAPELFPAEPEEKERT